MYRVRRWAVRHAGLMESVYNDVFEPTMVWLHPLWRWIGYERVERPIAALEKVGKGFLFDCRMCGHCILGAAGMSCPMNCPKNLRNGPCGGVRPNGHCEVKPEMRCVWVDAWEGSQRMRHGHVIRELQQPAPVCDRGSSSWLRKARERAAQRVRVKEGRP